MVAEDDSLLCELIVWLLRELGCANTTEARKG